MVGDMTNPESFLNVDTATLEAALLASTADAQNELTPAETIGKADENSQFETEAQVEIDQEFDPRAGWQDYERLASEIRERNPDILLDTALEMAKSRLGYNAAPENSEYDPEPQPDPEPTIAEKIDAVENALEEEGANEGLFTPKVAELTKELTRLRSQDAVEQAENRIYQARENDNIERQAGIERDELMTSMSESRARVFEMCPEAEDGNSAIGRAMSQLIDDYQAVGHPDLYLPNAPEFIFAKANMLLPPEARMSVAAPKVQPQPQSQAPRNHVQNASEPSPHPFTLPVPTARALPVSATARTAQPEMTTTNINSAQMGKMVREASREDLDAIEEAIYGVSGRDVLLRI